MTTLMSTRNACLFFPLEQEIRSPFFSSSPKKLKLEVKALNRQILFKPKSYSSASKRNPAKYLSEKRLHSLRFLLLRLEKHNDRCRSLQLGLRTHLTFCPLGLPLSNSKQLHLAFS
ncbi:hypothetical protein TNIN_347301 [Trichonephila inaurata madagascariensis]|uniref:Uncharacterized protein n=1 Tax=Trichonephila inaurata madagascariensis TaxID=2747483 RepID=A0A8X6IRQ2_9ARAC|nr:hypothetical protein TNIN_347301 [Trichonephila inaurata madagascariensis]